MHLIQNNNQSINLDSANLKIKTTRLWWFEIPFWQSKTIKLAGKFQKNMKPNSKSDEKTPTPKHIEIWSFNLVPERNTPERRERPRHRWSVTNTKPMTIGDVAVLLSSPGTMKTDWTRYESEIVKENSTTIGDIFHR